MSIKIVIMRVYMRLFGVHNIYFSSYSDPEIYKII